MVNLGGLGGWRLLVHVFLPIPLVLTLLLVVPFPRNLRKGILLFTHRTLSFTMIGTMRLVHFSLLASGIPLLDSAFRTMKSSQAVHEGDLRPEIKMTLLAKKWREERNFWIAAMSFMLWCLLSVLYRQVVYLTGLEEENDDLRDEVADLKGLPRPPRRDPGERLVEAATAAATKAREVANDAAGRAGRAARAAGARARAAAGDAAERAQAAAGEAAGRARRAAGDARKVAEAKVAEAKGAIADIANEIEKQAARATRRGAGASPSPASPRARRKAE